MNDNHAQLYLGRERERVRGKKKKKNSLHMSTIVLEKP